MSDRDQFEAAWIAANSDSNEKAEIVRNALLNIWRDNGSGGGAYFDSFVMMAWTWWQASREALKAEQEGAWIACSERMPEVCANVIVTDGQDTGFMWYCSDGRWDSWHSGDSVSGNVTHWQPLPAPPSQPHPIDTTSQQYETLAKGESK